MTNKKQNQKEDPKDDGYQPYMPGIEDLVREIFRSESIKTLKEFDTDKESMYLYQQPRMNILTGELTNPSTAGIYGRGEPEIKVIAERTYKKKIEEIMELCAKLSAELPDGSKDDPYAELGYKLNRKLIHDGISHHEITEVMQNIRRKTFVDRKTMNPDGFIPLKYGLLSLKDWKLYKFNPDRFFTWKAYGTYDPSIRSLNDTPLFKKFLMESYPPKSVQTLLDYMGYALYPSFPRQKILVIVGPPRMGKGTIANIMEKILNDGFGRISLMKLLILDNKFSLQGIEGKRLLVDTEIKREFKKNADFDVINSLFGGDPLPLEKKYHAEITYIAKSAGLLIGNLPLFRVDNSAFLSRLLITSTRGKMDFKEVPNMADIIFNAEGDKIVSLLLNRLKSLIQRDFKFSNELTNDEYAELWGMLSDSTQAFLDDRMVDASTDSDVDEAYKRYEEFCNEKGIPPESKHVFTFRVGRIYPKKRVKTEGKLHYSFTGCKVQTMLELQKETEEMKHKREMKKEEARVREERVNQRAGEALNEIDDTSDDQEL